MWGQILWTKSYWWVLYAASVGSNRDSRLDLIATLGWLQLLVSLTMKETLPPGSKRKPFSLRRANPLANVLLLFNSGPV